MGTDEDLKPTRSPSDLAGFEVPRYRVLLPIEFFPDGHFSSWNQPSRVLLQILFASSVVSNVMQVKKNL